MASLKNLFLGKVEISLRCFCQKTPDWMLYEIMNDNLPVLSDILKYQNVGYAADWTPAIDNLAMHK